MQLRAFLVVVLLAVLAAAVISQLSGGEAPAQAASRTVADAVTVIKSDVGWGQRLRAFEVLKKEGTADAIAELTGHKDVRVSTTA